MAFRKYGGLGFSSNQNIVSSAISSSDNLTVTNTIGQPNSKIISQSHIDMSGNSLMNVGSIYFFGDGSIQTTAYIPGSGGGTGSGGPAGPTGPAGLDGATGQAGAVGATG